MEDKWGEKDTEKNKVKTGGHRDSRGHRGAILPCFARIALACDFVRQDGILAEARATALAIHACSRLDQWGRQSCLQAAFQAAAESEQTTHELASIFSGFVSRRHRAAKPEKVRLVTERPAESRPLGFGSLKTIRWHSKGPK